MKNDESLPAFASAIIEQLGGPRIFRMAFGTALYDERDRSVTFFVGHGLRMPKRANRVIVRIDADDTYTVELWRVSKSAAVDSVKTVDVSSVYADSLRTVVELHSGLRLTLGTMGAR